MKLNKGYKQAIEQLSKKLPLSYELKKVGYAIKGEDLPLETRRKFSLADMEYYRTSKQMLFSINHISRMQSAFKRSGEQGIIDYIYWLNNNNKKLNDMFEKLKLEQVSDDVMDIASKGAKGFWKNLLDFLFAFLKVFGNNK
mgnify:FL=1